MPALTAHHISFSVSDMAKSRKFYEGVLGLEEIPRADFGEVDGVWYDGGGVQVHLIEMAADPNLGTPPPVIHPGASHAGFGIEDYSAMTANLDEKGIEYFGVAENGQIWCQDPDGWVIEFIQPGVL